MLSEISLQELLFDRQESFNDIVSCLVAREQAMTDEVKQSVDERLISNLKIINTITDECKKRGVDPAIYTSIQEELWQLNKANES